MLAVVGAVDEDALAAVLAHYKEDDCCVLTYILLNSLVIRSSNHSQAHSITALQDKGVKRADAAPSVYTNRSTPMELTYAPKPYTSTSIESVISQ